MRLETVGLKPAMRLSRRFLVRRRRPLLDLLSRVVAQRAQSRRQVLHELHKKRVRALVQLSLLSRYLHRRAEHLHTVAPQAVRRAMLRVAGAPPQPYIRVLRQLAATYWHAATAPTDSLQDAALRSLAEGRHSVQAAGGGHGVQAAGGGHSVQAAGGGHGVQAAGGGHSVQAAEEGFEDVPLREAFKGVEHSEELSVDRLRRFCGEAILDALRACRPTYADRDNCSGKNGKLLRKLVAGVVRIKVVRDVRPNSPISLFTPISEEPLAAVAATEIAEGEPIAQYAGELICEDDEEPADNSYLYELDPKEMRERGYSGKTLRINARTRGGVSRFINDCWSPEGLPARTPNCFAALVFDGKAKLPRMVVFATANIPQGSEIIIDYGPDYWKITTRTLLQAHAASALTNHERCAKYEEWLAQSASSE